MTFNVADALKNSAFTNLSKKLSLMWAPSYYIACPNGGHAIGLNAAWTAGFNCLKREAFLFARISAPVRCVNHSPIQLAVGLFPRIKAARA
jgi:hypothetical protein